MPKLFKKNNQNKYNTKRFLILVKGLFPAFIGIFLPKKKKRIILNSTRNEFFNFNTKYLFEHFIEHFPEYEIKYVINDEVKRKELNRQFGEDKNYFIETESLSGMFYALRAKVWVTNAFETPVGGIFLKFNRVVYLLGHGALFRAYVFTEKKLPLIKKIYYRVIKHNFSHYLVTSQALVDVAQKVFRCKKSQIVVLGEPMSDAVCAPDVKFIQKTFGKEILEDKNILYAPTWRQSSTLKLFPFPDMDFEKLGNFLEENKLNIFLRLHPSFEDDLSIYTEHSKRIKIIDTPVLEDINEAIGFFDLVITDYSSVHIGYLLLHKPVLFLPYDFEDYDKNMGFVLPYEQLTPGPKPKTLKEFMAEVLKLTEDSNYMLEERKKVSKIFNDYTKDSCKMNAEYINKNWVV